MLTKNLQTIIEPAVVALGFQLWGCEWAGDGRGERALRVFIDDANGGVSVDDCARISRQISAVLDVEDPIKGQYTLEVSSPGIERPLFTLAQCKRYIGYSVALRLRTAITGRRNFRGILRGVAGDMIQLELDDSAQMNISWQEVDRAHLVAKF